MARHTLIDINMNDELPSVIRKCNDNFRRVSSQQSMSTTQAVINEAERSDQALADAMAAVNETIANLAKSVEDSIAALRRWVEDKIAEVTKPRLFAPPVGTYLHCEQNPAETWIGTTWEKVGENVYLVSAGDGLPAGTEVGSNSYVLTASQMPQHSHTGPSHTHTMAHTHAKGSLATASAGAHVHVQYWTAKPNSSIPSQGNKNIIYNEYGAGRNFTGENTGSAGAHTHTISGSTAASSAASTGSAGTGSTGTAGGSSPVDNRPASIAVPLWRRTA